MGKNRTFFVFEISRRKKEGNNGNEKTTSRTALRVITSRRDLGGNPEFFRFLPQRTVNHCLLCGP